jgi:hypothetical protein
MTTFPAAGYISDAARTQAQQKDAFEEFLAATRQLPGAIEPSTLVISSGTITPARGIHVVDTEAAAASDDLTTVAQTNLPDGSLLLLRSASDARVVVVKHGAGGTGQVSIGDAADLSLVHTTMWLLLRRNGTSWEEVLRSYGSQAALFRTRYSLPNISVAPNAFTKRQEFAKGASLASAGTLNLGSDGNFFHVTGSTNISAIAASGPSAQAGTMVTLMFEGSLTMVHGSSLVLQDGANLAVTAGHMVNLVHDGSGVWREIGGRSGGVSIGDAVATDGLVENTATEGTLYTGTVKGGSLGTRGRARFEPILQHVETGELLDPDVQRSMTLRLKLNGATIWTRTVRVRFESDVTLAIGGVSRLEAVICADGTHTDQLVVIRLRGSDVTSGTGVDIDEETQVVTAVNFAADVTLALTAQFSVAGIPTRPASIRMRHLLLESLKAG